MHLSSLIRTLTCRSKLLTLDNCKYVCICPRLSVPLRAKTTTSALTKVNKFLIHLLFVATILCGFLGIGTDAKTQDSFAKCSWEHEVQIRQSEGWLRHVAEEPQVFAVTVLRTAPSSHRVVSSRPTRLLPHHGGKPTNHGGRWAKDKSFNLRFYPFLLSCRRHCWHRMTATSPRLYYVIALRRLLC